MNQIKIVGEALPHMPWQERPQGSDQIVWRHSGNPIIGWNPTPKTARIFNSAVLPYGSGFIGVFRADHKHGKPQLHVGTSADGVTWTIEEEEIHWT
ncbi:MAG: glycosylase, partial [Clostridia bacterium]|nr:glycosylase [Clostridia bacterium]